MDSTIAAGLIGAGAALAGVAVTGVGSAVAYTVKRKHARQDENRQERKRLYAELVAKFSQIETTLMKSGALHEAGQTDEIVDVWQQHNIISDEAIVLLSQLRLQSGVSPDVLSKGSDVLRSANQIIGRVEAKEDVREFRSHAREFVAVCREDLGA